jgi:hypothetical protein
MVEGVGLMLLCFPPPPLLPAPFAVLCPMEAATTVVMGTK